MSLPACSRRSRVARPVGACRRRGFLVQRAPAVTRSWSSILAVFACLPVEFVLEQVFYRGQDRRGDRAAADASGAAMAQEPVLRVCARCHVSKPLEEFPLKDAAKGWYGSYCRPCGRERSKEHYYQNVAAYMTRARMRAVIDRRRNRGFVVEYLSTHACVDCGESDPIVLEFDHRELRAKLNAVSRLVHMSTLNAVRAEIEKCDVRCGNCHRIRTTSQFRSYRLGEATRAYLI